MKKAILAVMCLAMVACGSTRKVYDESSTAIVESVERTTIHEHGYRYILEAYQYTPCLVRYEIHTNKPYQVGDRIVIGNVTTAGE